MMKRATKIKKEKVILKDKPYEELSEQEKADANLLFHIPDIAEVLSIIMLDEAKKSNCILKKETMNHLTKLIEQLRKFRERTKIMSLEQQERFGETSDALLDLLRTVYLNTGGNPQSIEALNISVKKAYEIALEEQA